MHIFEQLSAAFPPDKISWRVGKVTKDGKKAMALAYLDARDVMYRLDSVVGAPNWQRRYSHADKKTICEIGIKIDGEWVWKADGAGDSDIEAEKGAISDAFKRAAVNWGIGRYLYDVESPWVAINEYKQIEEGEYERLRRILPKPIPQRPQLTDDQKAAAALDHAKKHVDAFKAFEHQFTHEEYKQANKEVLDRIMQYPEAKKVLEEGGLG